jgi:hypothetical protein
VLKATAARMSQNQYELFVNIKNIARLGYKSVLNAETGRINTSLRWHHVYMSRKT